jgi:hypothetical protein
MPAQHMANGRVRARVCGRPVLKVM